MALTPRIEQIVADIKATHPQGLSLDELSEALLDKAVNYSDIDQIIGALEDAGFDLESPAPQSHDELARVLVAVRALVAESGHNPTVEEIASRTGLDPAVVRRALRFGRSAPGPKAND